jgi:hypothetical protein
LKGKVIILIKNSLFLEFSIFGDYPGFFTTYFHFF